MTYATGEVHCFIFEPGDGCSYRALFAQLEAGTERSALSATLAALAGHAATYLFGIGRYGEPLRTVQLRADELRPAAFARLWDDDASNDAAWALLCALVGRATDALDDWDLDWRDRLPPTLAAR